MTTNKASFTRRLMQVALGQQAADLAVIDAAVLNVYTGEILENQVIGTAGPRIAYVGAPTDTLIDSRTQVIDARGQVVIPGLIDGHTHLAWFYTPYEFLKYVIPGGTTSIVTETLEIYPVAGADGVRDFLAALKDQPINLWATAPAMASISDQTLGIAPEFLQELLDREDIVGLGESYWQVVLQRPDIYLPLFEQVQAAGKTLEGHTAGANAKRLMAYVAAGISSCHEPIKADEVLQRLRLGLYVMIREGSIRSDLNAIAPIKDTGVDLRRLILATDGISPVDLMTGGYLEHVVQKAIDVGFGPVDAVRMATLNVAEHFCLDHLIGGIAPGRWADLVIVPDIRTIDARYVIGKGVVVAEHGRLLVEPRRHVFETAGLNTVNLPQPVSPETFRIRAPAGAGEVQVRAIEMVTPLVTAESRVTMPVVDGVLTADRDRDLIKVAAVDRVVTPGRCFTGILKGFGLQNGAFACSGAWDTADIIVVGVSDTDMAAAVNRIRTLQGGVVVCRDGAVSAELAAPYFGLFADDPLPDLVRKIAGIDQAVQSMGVTLPVPILSLITLTGAAIPFLRICEQGLIHLKDGQPRELIVT